MKWYKTHKCTQSFPNGQPVLPTLLQSNLEVKDAVLKYHNDNLPILSGKLLHSYIL